MDRAEAVKELKETFSILHGDVEEVISLHGDEMEAFHVRMMIRTYSALIEGLLYQMRQVAINSEKEDHAVFSSEERIMLNEKSLSLNKKGEIEEKDNFERTLPMLLFTFKQYAKIHGGEFSPDTEGNGWKCMKQFIAIRNRIVHPKSKDYLVLSKTEWRDINIGIDWFNLTVKNLFAETDKADEYFRSQSKNQ